MNTHVCTCVCTYVYYAPSSRRLHLPPLIRSLLGPLRWQRANRPSTFKLLVPRPQAPSAEHDDNDNEEEEEETEDAASGKGKGKKGAVEEMTVTGTFPVGIALAEPGRVRPALRAAVLKLTGGAATEAHQQRAWDEYWALWRSHCPVPLARVPFLRFSRGIAVQRVMRLAGDGMEDPERRRAALRGEVAGMDAVDRMLLPATASLLRGGQLPTLVMGAPPPPPPPPVSGGAGGKARGRGRAAGQAKAPGKAEEDVAVITTSIGQGAGAGGGRKRGRGKGGC